MSLKCSRRRGTSTWAALAALLLVAPACSTAPSDHDGGVDASTGCDSTPCTRAGEVCGPANRCICGQGFLRDEVSGSCVNVPNPCAGVTCGDHGTCMPFGAGYTCACDAGWLGTSCDTAVVCTGLVAPAHGSISASSGTYLSSVTYACDAGFVLTGSSTRGCGADGNWNGSAPSCQPTLTPTAGIGDACANAAVCATPATSACLTTVRLFGQVEPADITDPSIFQAFSEQGIAFPEGYCSSQPNCASDSACGANGGCFRPFAEVTDDTLRDLEGPLGLVANALEDLPSFGVCLRTCNSPSDCETGQVCADPLVDIVTLVPGSISGTTYCITDASPCGSSPCLHGGECEVAGTNYSCDCASGWGGPNCETATVAIGGRCEQDVECNVPASAFGPARCLTGVHPLTSLLPSGSAIDDGFDFPYGYCSNAPNCAVNVECGPHGGCFAPFRDVTATTLRDLELSMDPRLASGTLDPLPAFGTCLRTCVDSLDCQPDQTCTVPEPSFYAAVPDSTNARPFCVPHDDCVSCASDAYCEVDASDASRAHCVCRPGFSGNGLTCTATGAGACADAPCKNGGTCSTGIGNAYTCSCTGGYTGTNCQIAPVCSPNPCLHGGTCSDAGNGSYACSCPAGFSGMNCQTN